MKNIFITCIVFCTMATTIFTACKKSPLKSLPPATQNGANTLGCLIEGVAYKTSGTKNTGANYCVTQNYISTSSLNGPLFVESSMCGEAPYNMLIFGVYDEILEGKSYTIKGGDNFYGNVQSAINGTHRYGSDSLTSGTITITKVTDKFVAGTFAFTLRDLNNNQFIHITDGRFDILR